VKGRNRGGREGGGRVGGVAGVDHYFSSSCQKIKIPASVYLIFKVEHLARSLPMKRRDGKQNKGGKFKIHKV